jgi:hypothetical protein
VHLHVSAAEGHHELRGQPRSFDASPTAIARDGFIVIASTEVVRLQLVGAPRGN